MSHGKTCVYRARSLLTSAKAVPLYHRAGDVQLFEGRHTQRGAQVAGRPDESIGSCDGDLRFTGRQDHHDRLDVGDGETRVLAKAPGEGGSRGGSRNQEERRNLAAGKMDEYEERKQQIRKKDRR